MQRFNLNRLFILMIGCLVLSVSTMSCSKDGTKPVSVIDYGTHAIDPQLAGEWMWTSGSDGAYYDDNGVYHGAAYGFATKFTVDAKGNGTCFQHVYSSIGEGSELEVNIAYSGYYEMDSEGNLNFYPMSGTYNSTSGTHRNLHADELYNPATGGGRILTYPAVQFTTQNDRECIKINYDNGETEYFYKL